MPSVAFLTRLAELLNQGSWKRSGTNSDSTMQTTGTSEGGEGSLKRVRRDRIDVYPLIFGQSFVERRWKTLAQLRNEGKIRLIGCPSHARAHRTRTQNVPIVSVQNRMLAARDWDYVVNYVRAMDSLFLVPLGRQSCGDVLNRHSRGTSRKTPR